MRLLLVVTAFAVSVCHADYLYMSCHANPNIIAFDVDTSSLSTDTLLNTSAIDWISSDDLHFRGTFIQNDILYVANSKASASFIGKWQCNANASSSTPLSFIGNFTGLSGSNPGLVHPYGIRWYGNQYLYATTQDTQSLLLYDANGSPDTSKANSNTYPGAVVTFGPYNSNSNGLRDLAVDEKNGLVFVAEEILQIVLVYDANNKYANIFNISIGSKSEPIGLRINQDLHPNTLFIGDNGYNAVYAYSYNPTLKSAKQIWKSKEMSDLSHPAGIDVNEKYVFVVAQNNNLILQFDASTGSYLKKFADFSKLKVTGENLLYYSGRC